MESTPSGLYLRADGAGGVADGPQDRVAAKAFPKVSGAVVVHVHTDPASGLLAVGGQLLTLEEFHADVMPLLRLEPDQLLVLVACRIGAVQAGAQALADLAGRPVLAASGDVFTTPAGAVEVRQAVVDPTGHMTLDAQGRSLAIVPAGPGGTGVLDGVLNLRFFTRSGQSLGVFEVIGISDRGEDAGPAAAESC